MQQTSFSKLKGIRIGVDTSDEVPRIVGVARTSVRFETCDPRVSPELERALALGNTCTACPQPGTVLAVPLKTPALPIRKLQKILPGLLDVQIPLPLSECATAFVNYETAFMAYAIRKTDLRRLIDALAEQGCNPARIVPSVHAAWTLCLTEHPPARADEARALFIATPKQTILVTGHGKILERQSQFKTNAEEPVRRLKLAFGGMPEQLVCIIAGSAHADTREALSTIDQPSGTTFKSVTSPDFFLARALACDSRSSGTIADADLRQSVFPHPAVTRRQQRPAIILTSALAACAIILASVALTSVSTAANTAAQTRAALQSRLDTLAGYPIRTQGERALQDARAAMPLNLDQAIQLHIDDPLPNEIATVARCCKQHEITVQHLFLNAEGLTASGSAKSAEDVSGFVQALKAKNIATTLTEPPKPTSNAGVTFFTLPTKP